MKVPLLDPRRANGAIETELRAAFDEVLHSGQFILGGTVTRFEEACASYLGVKHAIGVSSGTDALLVSLMALGVRPGDEVICPTFTFFATAGSVWRAGARPVFVDSQLRCFNCDPTQIADKINERTRAIIPVHLFGQCAEMEPILAIARERGVAVIEDAAQAIGAEYRGKRAGGVGDLGCFSFFPSKNLGGFGDAGLVTTNDDDLAACVHALRTHGGAKMYEHPAVGGNFRIDAIQAALLTAKLPFVDDYARARQANATRYTELLMAAGVGAVAGDGSSCSEDCSSTEAHDRPLLLPSRCQSNHVFNQYTIRVRGGRRDALMAHLKEQGVGCAIYYPKPLHLQPCFAELGHKPGDFPRAEQLAGECLALPVFSELATEELEYVVKTVVGFFGQV